MEGFAFGAIAAVILGASQILAALAIGESGSHVFRLWGSVLLSERAMSQPDVGAALLGGVVVLVLYGVLVGALYGLVLSLMSDAWRTSWARQLAMGGGAGLFAYLLVYQLVARSAFPWFMDEPQVTAAVLFILFFGLPLGALYLIGERSARSLSIIPSAT